MLYKQDIFYYCYRNDLNDVIFLEDEPEVILKKFKKAVTDSENKVKFDPENKPGVSNLMQIYSAITGKSMEEIEAEFEGRGYGDFKVTVANSVIDKLKPIQERYKEILEDKKYLEEIYYIIFFQLNTYNLYYFKFKL